jgi:uncharacterized lipoprotein YehR (DUF1307 family)
MTCRALAVRQVFFCTFSGKIFARLKYFLTFVLTTKNNLNVTNSTPISLHPSPELSGCVSRRTGINFIVFAMLAFALSAFAFTGCAKEEEQDGKDDSTNALAGTWLCTYAKSDCGGGEYEEFFESQGITWIFNADGTGSLRNVNGQTMNITYILKDKVITINSSMGNISYTVVSLTASSLVLERKGTCSENWTFKRNE